MALVVVAVAGGSLVVAAGDWWLLIAMMVVAGGWLAIAAAGWWLLHALMVADDGLVGIEKGDLVDLIRHIRETYEGIHMDISEAKTAIFGVAGVQKGEAVSGGPAHPEVQVQLDVMEHLGAALYPLGQVFGSLLDFKDVGSLCR